MSRLDYGVLNTCDPSVRTTAHIPGDVHPQLLPDRYCPPDSISEDSSDDSSSGEAEDSHSEGVNGRRIPLKSQPNIRAMGVAPTPNQPKN
ncbi:hypothetical protein E1B28_006836 [Marasmius oreades]|uniref:Uncharacterized protein n=1 Tax=Marasmius oreades TaxID=181124 RepID=A0A9P8ABD2_9AGAR|nr:uncharacterized protein E1B28_006836 [Marasmius oreades]KAG7096163.1 hypothetical protein E1B28_006836 [Marasmius oreades]